jgi:hypothetical protein
MHGQSKDERWINNEVEELKPMIKEAADAPKSFWSDDNKLHRQVLYITSEKVWKDFKSTKAKDFVQVHCWLLKSLFDLTRQNIIDCSEGSQEQKKHGTSLKSVELVLGHVQDCLPPPRAYRRWRWR